MFVLNFLFSNVTKIAITITNDNYYILGNGAIRSQNIIYKFTI
jgi:hypothetical protein